MAARDRRMGVLNELIGAVRRLILFFSFGLGCSFLSAMWGFGLLGKGDR